MAKKTYTEEERKNILRVYQASRVAGASKLQSARDAQTPYYTIRNWLAKEENNKTVNLPSEGALLEDAVKAGEEAEEEVETTYYEFQGHLEEGKPMKSTIRPIEPPADPLPPLDGPCLVLPNGFRVYGPFEELWDAAVAVG